MVQINDQVKDEAGSLLDAIFCIAREITPNGNSGFISNFYIKTIFVKGQASVSRCVKIFTMADGSTYEIL